MQWTSGSELCHHGRPGQKWGVENGPPYPLSRQGFGTTKSYRKVMQNVAKSVGDTVKKKVKQFKSSREEAKKRVLAKKQEKEEAKKRAIEEAKNKERKELVESGDIKRILRNQSELSEQEIRDAISRVKLNQELASFEVSRINKGVNAISHIMANAAKIGDAVENGVKTWNTFAKVANSLTKASFPIVDEKYAKEKAAKAKAGAQVANDLANIGLEGMLKNQSKYTTEQIKDAKERYQNLNSLEKSAKAKKEEAAGKDKSKKLKPEEEVAKDLETIGLEGMLKNPSKYTTAQLKEAKERSEMLNDLEKIVKSNKNSTNATNQIPNAETRKKTRDEFNASRQKRLDDARKETEKAVAELREKQTAKAEAAKDELAKRQDENRRKAKEASDKDMADRRAKAKEETEKALAELRERQAADRAEREKRYREGLQLRDQTVRENQKLIDDILKKYS